MFKIINLKKVRRIKRDFDLVTTIRRKSKYRFTFADGRENLVSKNLVQRDFNNSKLALVDITEMRIRNGQKMYLFAMKNALTREILAFNVSTTPSMSFVTTAVDHYLSQSPEINMIHSDQGVHFTCSEFRDVLKKRGIIQSMSRKGNCLDNAPIESFFGHMKDELDYKECRTVEEFKSKLKRYIKYYNNGRPQWTLKQKTPAEAGVELSLVY